MPESALQQRTNEIESLVSKLDTLGDDEARATSLALVRALTDFYGSGIERILEITAERTGVETIDHLCEDPLVSSLLLLHGLHPLDMATRVEQALERVRPYLGSHGGGVELAGIDGSIVRLRMKGTCQGCPSSTRTMKLAIEDAVYEAAPEVTGIVAEGQEAEAKLSVRSTEAQGGWEEVGVTTLADGFSTTLVVGGRSVVFCRLGESLYAYGSVCARCGAGLEDSTLESASLVCAACKEHFEIAGAGRGRGEPAVHLEPFPLLIEDGRAMVAVH
ncbi:MAG TPA: NifU family protein [Thermoanaerobaculia bacterium]|nr:NifU family protein [Thermoanaerobaculia bacterium]